MKLSEFSLFLFVLNELGIVYPCDLIVRASAVILDNRLTRIELVKRG